MNIYSQCSFHLESFSSNHSPVQTVGATDARLVSNERFFDFLSFESNLAFVAQTVLKWEWFEEKLPGWKPH